MNNRWRMRGTEVVGIAVMLAGWVGCNCPTCSNPFGEDHSPDYQLLKIFEVAGRQGIATDGERYFNSGTTAFYVYSKDGKLLVPGLKTTVERARLFGTDAKLTTTLTGEGLEVTVPGSAPNPIASVIALDLDGEPLVK